MNTRSSSSSWAQWLIALALFTLAISASAQATGPAASNQVTLSLDQDLITFTKWAASLGGIFLAMFAGIGVLFFGWDVVKTRNALFDARVDIANRLDSVRSDHAALKDLKEKLEQLGAQLEEQLVKKALEQIEKANSPAAVPPSEQDRSIAEINAEVDKNQEKARRARIGKANADLVEAAIERSDFEWTTLPTLMAKTGLTADEIMLSLQWSSVIEAKRSKSGGQLFRLSPKKTYFDPSTMSNAETNEALEALKRAGYRLGPDDGRDDVVWKR